MKKIGILLLLVLFSCGKAALVPEPEIQAPIQNALTPIRFELTATHPADTKAVKTGWENGDVIFVFFRQDASYTPVVSPNYLKMSFDGTAWTSTEMGSLGLANGDKGKMTAVYLPFGNSASISADSDGNYVFNPVYQSYYLTGELDYEVQGNKVSGQLAMQVPDGFVQFYVTDFATSQSNGKYMLATDAVTPHFVQYVDRNANVHLVESDDSNMPGYVYCKGNVKGYLFSGVLKGTSDYKYTGNYYLSKTEWNGDNLAGRSDYFVKGVTLKSRDSILLPNNGASDKWIPVGSGYSVDFGGSVGEWKTCNEGALYPQQLGGLYPFSSPDQTKLPTKEQYEALGSLNHYPMSIYGQPGVVICSGSKFIFLPVHPETKEAYYWTSTLHGSEPYQALVNKDTGVTVPGYSSPDNQWAVRLLK